MDTCIRRIGMIRFFIALRHTAFHTKIKYAYTYWYKSREQKAQEEKCAVMLSCFSELLNVLKATDFVIYHRTSRFFLYRTRGPPLQSFFRN